VDPNGVLANDSDVDGDPLVSVLISGPAHGTLVLNEDGSFVYTPNGEFVGWDSFTYLVTDGLEVSEMTSAMIEVQLLAPASAGDSHSDSGDGAAKSRSDVSEIPVEQHSVQEANRAESSESPESTANSTGNSTHDGLPMGVVPDSRAVATDHDNTVDTVGVSAEENSQRRILDTEPSRRSEHSQGRTMHTSDGLLQALAASEQTSTLLWDRLDSMQSDMLRETESSEMIHSLVVGTTALATSGLAVGYTIWALRAGSFLASMLSALPAWVHFDPIPILDEFKPSARASGRDEDEETLQSLLTG
jgi:hypothetical protein